jgi:hypothetical protein
MAKKYEVARRQTNALTEDEAEKLFETVDETGHSNEERARREKKLRSEKGQGEEFDPLSAGDPSGSNVGQVIAKTAVGVVVTLLVVIVAAQVIYGLVRRSNTADLSSNVTVSTVASALRGGVEWGNGFTQFPEDFSVQEADENTGTVEVTVIDTSSEDALECFAGSQVQAAAFSVNCLLNPNIDTVIYHVNVHMDSEGNFQQSLFFGFFKPTGDVTSFMTFVWTKTQSSDGVYFNCSITGVNDDVQDELRDAITTSFTPVQIISDLTGSSSSSSSDSQ